MNQVKIGKFIALCRKNKNLTQAELAEKLNITDRAISKWETGKGMPDVSLMLDLCNELEISVNELLSGEMIDMENYDKRAEELLLEMAKREEQYNKKLLFAMYVIGILSTVFFLSICFIATLLISDKIKQFVIIIPALIVFLIGIFITLKLEVEAGYYECKNCHYKFVPTYKEVLCSAHMGMTRYLKCPKCNKKSWSKKVISEK